MVKKLFDIQLFATPVQPATNNSFNYSTSDRDNFTGFGKLLEVRFNRIFFETYDEAPEEYTQIYNVKTSDKAIEREWGMGAFGDWTKRATQFDTVAYKTLSPGLERTYVHEAFTQGFMITREMYDDDMTGQLDKLPAALARSGRAKVEKDAMIPLYNGFSADVGGVGKSAIYDGKALFANDHPLLDAGGKVGKNLLTGVLNDTNLKAAIKQMRETPDEAGNFTQYRVDTLIVPPALYDTAIRLTESVNLTGGNLNDTNKFLRMQGIKVVVLDNLSAAAGGSDTAWYVQDSKRHELNFYWRVRPEFKWDEDFDTFVARYRGYMRYSFGVSDWRGIAGSTGL